MPSDARRALAGSINIGKPTQGALAASTVEPARVVTVLGTGAATTITVRWRGVVLPAMFLESYTPAVDHVVAVTYQPGGGLLIQGRIVGGGAPEPIDPPPAEGELSAGPDASISSATTLTRTATEPAGAPITARAWTIQAGPLGAGTTIGTTAALSWKPGSSPANTVDIRQPVVQEMCYQIVSTVENGTTAWTTAYRYIEDIDDDRGYTAGLVGFTSATGDMLLLVQQYAVEKPGNTLASYIDGLEACATVGYGPGASAAAASNLGAAYQTAWRNAADNDPVFRKVQRDFRKSMYWDDALTQALADEVGPLGLCLHYDILVNHGPGDDDESYGGILAAARASAHKPPSDGGGEAAYLIELCDIRDEILMGWGDYQEDGRSTIFRSLVAVGKLTLLAPFEWSVYGDNYTMPVRPTPATDSLLGSYTLRYTATGAGFDEAAITVV